MPNVLQRGFAQVLRSFTQPQPTSVDEFNGNARKSTAHSGNTDCSYCSKLQYIGGGHGMLIHTMTEAECRHALQSARIGRLGCARDNQPYVVPIYFAYSNHYLYAISTLGQKIEWMRANPSVCLEVDDVISREQWISIVVFGRYEELPNLPKHKRAREEALMLLQTRSPWWWEPACICEDHRDTPHSCTPIAFRIRIDRLSGLRATPDVGVAAVEKAVKRGWLAHLFSGPRTPDTVERNVHDQG